jgi:hypothetical protein
MASSAARSSTSCWRPRWSRCCSRSTSTPPSSPPCWPQRRHRLHPGAQGRGCGAGADAAGRAPRPGGARRPEREIDSRELVPGDVVLLEPGSRVPADLRLATPTGCRSTSRCSPASRCPVTKRPTAVDEDAALADRDGMAFTGSGRHQRPGPRRGGGHRRPPPSSARSPADPHREQIPRPPAAADGPLRQGHRRRWWACAAVGGVRVGPALGGEVRRCSSPPWRSPWPPSPRAAGGVHDHAGARGAPHGPAQRHRPAAAGGRDARQHHGDRLRQDRHAHREPDDGAGGLGRRRSTTGGWVDGRRPASVVDDGEPAARRADDHRPLHRRCSPGCSPTRPRPTGPTTASRPRATPPRSRCWCRHGRRPRPAEEVRERTRWWPRSPSSPSAATRRCSLRERRRARRVREGRTRAGPRDVHRCSPPTATVPIDSTAPSSAAHEMAADGLRVLAMADGPRAGPADPDDSRRARRPGVLLGLQGMLDPPRPGVREAIAGCRRRGSGWS